MIDKIKNLIDSRDIVTAFDLMDLLDWGDKKGTYNDLKGEWIDPPVGKTENDILGKIKVLLSVRFPSNANNNFKDQSYIWHEKLLDSDFISQKKEIAKSENKTANFILMQGTPMCGMHYFIMHKHNQCNVKTIKANTISIKSSEIEDWQQILEIFGISLNLNTTKHIPTVISESLENQLREKPIVVTIYAVELWGQAYLKYLEILVNYLKQIPLEAPNHPFYCYFVYTGDKEVAFSDNMIILPRIDDMDDNELFNLCDNAHNQQLFKDCSVNIREKLSGKKRLSEVIEVFLEYSTCGQELRNHLNKIPPFH